MTYQTQRGMSGLESQMPVLDVLLLMIIIVTHDYYCYYYYYCCYYFTLWLKSPHWGASINVSMYVCIVGHHKDTQIPF